MGFNQLSEDFGSVHQKRLSSFRSHWEDSTKLVDSGQPDTSSRVLLPKFMSGVGKYASMQSSGRMDCNDTLGRPGTKPETLKDTLFKVTIEEEQLPVQRRIDSDPSIPTLDRPRTVTTPNSAPSSYSSLQEVPEERRGLDGANSRVLSFALFRQSRYPLPQKEVFLGPKLVILQPGWSPAFPTPPKQASHFSKN